MKIQKLIHKNNNKLLLFFAGWSASPEIFSELKAPEDTDIWICYDYRTLTFQEDLSQYPEITLIAWSLGVWVASLILETSEYRFTKAIAINGTPCPIHNQCGIPEAIFLGTLKNITTEGMLRFNRRMCGSPEMFLRYKEFPVRPVQEIEEELQNLFRRIKEKGNIAPSFWTQAVISVSDHIFPADNLRHYWAGHCPVTEIKAPHYPFYLWKRWNEIYEQ